MDIGQRLKKKRQEANLTQKELAEILFVSRQTISSWEVGRTYPDLEALVAISELYHTPLDDLLKEDSQLVKDITKKVKKSERRKIINIVLAILLLLVTATSTFYAIRHYQNNQINAQTNAEGLSPNDLIESTWQMNYSPIDELSQAFMSFDKDSLVVWNQYNILSNLTPNTNPEDINEMREEWLEKGLEDGIITYEDLTIKVDGNTYLVSGYGYSQEFTRLSDTIIRDANGIEYFKTFSSSTHEDLYSLAELMNE